MVKTTIDYAALFQCTPTPLMVVDHELRFITMNDAYLKVTGSTEADIIGRHVFDAFPESEARRAPVEDALRRGLAGEEVIIERIPFLIDRPGLARREMFWTAYHTPVRAIDGSVIAVMQHTKDVTPEVEAERMRAVISQEYDHRVRNIMAKVSAIARQTARQNYDIGQFLADFDRRMTAMTRTHTLLINGGWEELGLRALVESALQPYAGFGSAQVSIDGPDRNLSSRVGQALGLALHELATNAAKYGALSCPHGRLAINWHSTEDGGIDLEWRESGLADLALGTRSGFGTTIIDRVLPLETGGAVTRVLSPTGLGCTIALPQPMRV